MALSFQLYKVFSLIIKRLNYRLSTVYNISFLFIIREDYKKGFFPFKKSWIKDCNLSILRQEHLVTSIIVEDLKIMGKLLTTAKINIIL